MSFDSSDLVARRGERGEDASPPLDGLYDELCEVETLRLAYARAEKESQNLGTKPLAVPGIGEKGVEEHLSRLADKLRARTYHPAKAARGTPLEMPPMCEGGIVPRDLVVRTAVKLILEKAFAPQRPCDPEPEKAVRWIAGIIEKGFGRVYAVKVNGFPTSSQERRIRERLARRIGEPELVRLIKELVATTVRPGHPRDGIIDPLLSDIAFEGIDRILEDAKTLAREGRFPHAHCLRVGDELAVFVDHDSRYDWLVPAVRKRLAEELSDLQYDVGSADSQSVDLMRGARLQFLGFELRCVTGKRGEPRVHYKTIEQRGVRPEVVPLGPHQGATAHSGGSPGIA